MSAASCSNKGFVGGRVLDAGTTKFRHEGAVDVEAQAGGLLLGRKEHGHPSGRGRNDFHLLVKRRGRVEPRYVRQEIQLIRDRDALILQRLDGAFEL